MKILGGASRSPVVIALDDEWRRSQVWIKRLKGEVWGFKVGSILFAERGPKVVETILKEGHRVFLDLKYCDIPNTVEKAVKVAFSWGVHLLTVHASGGRGMLEAAAQHQTRDQKILAVTVLTSLESRDLVELGISRSVASQVRSLGNLAISSGIGGLVCSPLEVGMLRRRFPKTVLVTPGVRLAEAHDQKRTATLTGALEEGASLVVLGRALTASKNWELTWQQLISSSDVMSSKKRLAKM